MKGKLRVGEKDSYREIFFLNRTIQHWNQLPAEVLGILPCKPTTFKKWIKEVIIELN